jgi:hypothetical protein
VNTYCNYTIDQISESGLLPETRVYELKEKLRTLPYEAFTKDGRRIPDVIVAPTINGDNAFVIGYGDAIGFMNRHVLQTLLTPEESEDINTYCTSATQAKREAFLMEKAKAAGQIIPAEKWDGGVFWDDEYYWSVDSFIEDMEDIEENYELPQYLYAAKPRKVVNGDRLYDDILGRLTENGWEDISDNDFYGLDELKTAIEAFEKANENVVVNDADCSTLIDVSEVKRRHIDD